MGSALYGTVLVMNDDGTMARGPQLEVFARQHNLKMGTTADLIRHRLRTERSVKRISQQRSDAEALLDVGSGIYLFRVTADETLHVNNQYGTEMRAIRQCDVDGF